MASGPFLPPLRSMDTAIASRIRRDYFSTIAQSILTVSCLLVLIYLVWKVLSWAFIGAVWAGAPQDCRAADGACWAAITSRYRLILFGLYPYAEQWRSMIACIAIVTTVVLSCVPKFWSVGRLTSIWIIGFTIFYFLMRGGIFGLPLVLETEWGGLSLTLFVFSMTILIGMPLAIILALMRRSTLPVVAKITAVLIDAVRSLPLITVLFMAAIMLPFALPDFLQGEKLYRVILAAAIFFAVYQAEIIRGGMQGIPAGQEEACLALGLNYWQTVSRIILPQAFRLALPSTINQVITAFMLTTEIVILGFFETMGAANAAIGSEGWRSAYVEIYFFVGLIYFVFCFSLSRFGEFLEGRYKR